MRERGREREKAKIKSMRSRIRIPGSQVRVVRRRVAFFPLRPQELKREPNVQFNILLHIHYQEKVKRLSFYHTTRKDHDLNQRQRSSSAQGRFGGRLKLKVQRSNSHLDEEDVEGDEEHSEDHPHEGRQTTQTVAVLVQSDHLKNQYNRE